MACRLTTDGCGTREPLSSANAAFSMPSSSRECHDAARALAEGSNRCTRRQARRMVRREGAVLPPLRLEDVVRGDEGARKIVLRRCAVLKEDLETVARGRELRDEDVLHLLVPRFGRVGVDVCLGSLVGLVQSV